ncbi:unnamed protein product, partial [Symbiodinium sp. KB8]
MHLSRRTSSFSTGFSESHDLGWSSLERKSFLAALAPRLEEGQEPGPEVEKAGLVFPLAWNPGRRCRQRQNSCNCSERKYHAVLHLHFSHYRRPRYRNSGAFVHGTKFLHFSPIMEQGLKAAKSEIFMIDEVRPDGRVPGLKEAPEILIFIDEEKARSENMEFDYDAKEGTWKTRGIDGVPAPWIRPWFFQKVVDQRAGPGRGNVLFQSKEDPLMQVPEARTKVQNALLLLAVPRSHIYTLREPGLLCGE